MQRAYAAVIKVSNLHLHELSIFILSFLMTGKNNNKYAFSSKHDVILSRKYLVY